MNNVTERRRIAERPARISLFVSARRRSAVARSLSRFIAPSDPPSDPREGAVLTLPGEKKVWCCVLDDSQDSLHRARSGPMGAIVIDNRADDGSPGITDSLAGHLLPELLVGAGSRKVPQRRSILIVLPQSPVTPYHAYAVGTFQIGGILVAPKNIEEILEAAYRISRPERPGKVALCLAGGGIEGMFWETGVLRALDAHLRNASLSDFDIFSGISAGSVLCALIANGVRPYEIANALHGRPSRVDPITRAMLFDPNIGEITRRVIASLGDLARGRWITRPIDSAMRVTPTALFSGERLKEYLDREFAKPGMCNDFNCLKKQLFIGATDQDQGTHVSFGAEGWKDIPISTAVRASTAMTPYYNPQKIGDRFFVDGIFTRTIDIDVAVANGATLILCADPLRPVQTREAGYVSGRGGLFNTVQSVKSMIRSRFAEMMTKAEEAHPHVSVYVFSPTAKDMEQMSGTMMRFFYRTDTEKMAYDSAVEQIGSDYEWLAEDLQRHGYELSRPGN